MRRVIETAKAVQARRKADALGDVSAGLSFWAFLSLFPAVLALASLVGYLEFFVGDDTATDVRDEITDAIDRALDGDAAAGLKRTALDILNNPRGGLAIVGTVVALFSMGKGFSGLCRALGRIRGAAPRAPVFDRAVGMGLGLGTLGVLLIVALQIVVGPLFGFERLLPEEGSKRLLNLWQYVLRWPVLIAIAVAWLTVLLRVGSRDHGPWRAHLPGAVLTMVFWGVLTLAFRLAVHFGLLQANPVFGVVGGVILFLTWLNLMSTGILLGGELNIVLTADRQAQVTVRAVAAPPTAPGRLSAVAATALLVGGLLNRPGGTDRRR